MVVCVPPGKIVACAVERRDPQQLEHELAAVGRRLLAEGGDLLLLGEDRGPEGGVTHAQDRVDVAARIPHALGHLLAVGVGLRLDLGVGPADRAAHEVQVALVLELHLAEALGVHARRAHLVHLGP